VIDFGQVMDSFAIQWTIEISGGSNQNPTDFQLDFLGSLDGENFYSATQYNGGGSDWSDTLLLGGGGPSRYVKAQLLVTGGAGAGSMTVSALVVGKP
jgi:hypothetical protein